MPLEGALIGYAALASLALVQKKNRPAHAGALLPSPPAARSLGIALLLLSALVVVRESGAAMGSVVWIAQLCVAGTALVLLLSWRPQLAYLIAVGVGVAGLVAALL
jgi:hypothetical protein